MMHPENIAEPQEVQPFNVGVFVISLEGEFDIAERPRLLDAFAATTDSPLVVIDFEKTRYVDSTVLECLVALERAVAKRGAKLTLVGLRPEIRRIFEVCGLERLFDIRGTLGDATDNTVVDSIPMRKLSLIAQPAPSLEAVEGDLWDTR